MGTNALITVIALAIIFTIINTTMNRRDREAYENTYGYEKFITAQDIAHSAIQITLRKIDTVKVVTAGLFPMTGTLDGGSYQVDGVVVNDSTLTLTSNSKFMDSTYKIKTTMIRRQLPLPSMKGAFGIYPDNVGFTYKSTGATVDGRDHDIYGNYLPASTDTVSPFDVRTVTDSSNVYSAVLGPPNNLSSLIGTPKIKVDAAIFNPNTSSDQYQSNFDYRFPQSGNATTTIGTNLGDSLNPVIVYCDGKNSGTGLSTGKFKLNAGMQGWGLLVCKGNLSMDGGAIWHGLVIIYGNTNIDFDGSQGNIMVIGGIMMGGANTSTYKVGGGAKFYHSKAALDLLKNLKNPSIYQIVDWYE